MLYIRLMHLFFIVVLLIADALVNAIGVSFGFNFVSVVGNLTFLGILLLMQNDDDKQTILKLFLLSLWMDLNHVNSFPIFLISYFGTLIFIRYWKRHITTNLVEFSSVAILALFIKETITYVMIGRVYAIEISFLTFFVERIFWVIVINVLLIYPLLWFYKKIHHAILTKTQDLSGY